MNNAWRLSSSGEEGGFVVVVVVATKEVVADQASQAAKMLTKYVSQM